MSYAWFGSACVVTTGRRTLVVSLSATAILVGGGDPRERTMISVPIWLFYFLLGMTVAALVGLLWVWSRVQKLIDRILDEELCRPRLTDQDQARHGQQTGDRWRDHE
jgi:hypothetical protein